MLIINNYAYFMVFKGNNFKIITCLSAFIGIILDYIPYFIEYKGYNIRL